MKQADLFEFAFTMLAALFEKLEESHEITGVHHGKVYKERGWWTIKLPRQDSELSEVVRVKIDESDSPEYVDAEFLCNYISDGRGELPGGFVRMPIKPNDQSDQKQPLAEASQQPCSAGEALIQAEGSLMVDLTGLGLYRAQFLKLLGIQLPGLKRRPDGFWEEVEWEGNFEASIPPADRHDAGSPRVD